MKTDPSTESDPAAPRPRGLVLADVEAAARRLRGAVRRTPCRESAALGREAGLNVFLKLEQLQETGSFKERGAAHALAVLPAEQRRRGVVAASAGNHALGLARHGGRLGIPVTLVMPPTAARVKVARCRALGAEVVFAGETFDDAARAAQAIARREGRALVHPFDDVAVMAGQGTLGLELLGQLGRFDAVLVPVGGGGLLAGLAVALKSRRPDVRIIAVEPESAASYAGAWRLGRVVAVPTRPTLADGLAVAEVGRTAWEISRPLVDATVTVSEEEIAHAMLRLFEAERLGVEGAGAVALAAALAGKVPELAGARVVVPITGANCDPATFKCALEMAIAAGVAGSIPA